MSSDGAVERRIVSVLFADLVGFTSLAERLDAEDVAAVQDAYFAAVRETIRAMAARWRSSSATPRWRSSASIVRVTMTPRARSPRAGGSLVGAVERLGGQLGLGADELQLRVGIENGEVVSAGRRPSKRGA